MRVATADSWGSDDREDASASIEGYSTPPLRPFLTVFPPLLRGNAALKRSDAEDYFGHLKFAQLQWVFWARIGNWTNIMSRNRSSKRFFGTKSNRQVSGFGRAHRGLRFESLETRQLLSITLPTIADQTVLAGAPLNLGLDATNSTGNAVTYTVSVSNSALTATIPQSNPSLKLVVDDAADNIHGTMVFQLTKDLTPETVDKIVSLVNQDFYNGLTFHRLIKDFMIQGGDPLGTGTGGPGFKFDDEFNTSLQFTSPGLLAMANSGDDTNGSQFFITTKDYRYGDFNYTIFGVLTEGADILAKLNKVTTNTTTDKPVHDIKITDASIITDTQNGVLRLSAPTGTTGTSTVTVTATDSVTHESTSKTFTVTMAADTNNDPPFIGKIGPIRTLPNTPIEFNIPGVDAEGDAIYYTGSLATANSNLTVNVNSSTGHVTVTPGANLSPGVYSLSLSVAASSTGTKDTQTVLIYVDTAPELTAHTPSLGSITEDGVRTLLLSEFINSATGTSITDADSSAIVGGIAVCGQTGNGTWSYSTDGTTFTAIGNVSASSSLLLAKTATLRYTPSGANGETPTITYRAWDAIGGTSGSRVDLSATGATGTASPFSAATDTATLTVTDLNDAPVLTAVNPSLGIITSNGAATTISLATFINNGSGTTTITDADTGAVKGGIALTGTTGAGTWAYSTDGTTFIDVGTVSVTSSLLLPASAKLRYTPGATETVSPAATYRAWDTTSGTAATKVDTTTNGGVTAFSATTDTATLATGVVTGYVYLDVNGDGQMAGSETKLAGVTVRLFSKNDSGTLSELTAISPVQTNASGAYSFQGLVAGNYVVQVVPSAKVQAAQSTFSVALTSGQTSSGHNFAITGVSPAQVSLRMFLNTTPPMPQYIESLREAPSVSLSGTGATSNYAATYSTGGTAVAIGSSTATIACPDSPTLTSMTVTLQNPADGSSEQLQAVTTNTSLTASYANNVLTISGVADVSVYQTVLRSIKYSNTATPSTVGSRTISIVVNDGTTTSAAVTTTITAQKGSVPSGYSITANNSMLTSTTAASTGFTFANAVVGTTYSYTISSSGGGTAVTGTGTVTSATQNISGINVSTLPYGTLTYSVTLTNGAGAGTAATAKAILDQYVPSGYAITAGSSKFNATTGASASFTLTNAEVGSTYNYAITSSNGGTTVTGSGKVTSATQAVSGINLSSLNDGTLTFSVTLTNGVGTGTAATTTSTLDDTLPAGYSVTANPATLNSTNATAAGFTFTGAETDATYSYSIASSGGGTAVTGTGSVGSTQAVSGINVSSLLDGTLTFSVKLTDSAGNIGTAVTCTAILDRVAPTGYSIAANPTTLNSTTATTAGFTFAGAETNATYSYTITSSGGGTAVTGTGTIGSATQAVSGIDVSSLLDGTLTFSVTLTDTRGNVGTAVTSTATLNRTA